MSFAAAGVDGGARFAVFDALVRSRAVVLDEMATRHRAVGLSESPEIQELHRELAEGRRGLANLLVRGPDEDEPARYRASVGEAREVVERAERALAERSASFAAELARSRLGLDEVLAGLPEDGALVSFVLYGEEPIARDEGSSTMRFASLADYEATTPSYLAFVVAPGSTVPEVVPLGRAADIDDLVTRWRRRVVEGATLASVSPAEAERGYRETGRVLREKIWDPLKTHLRDARRVFIVPDGSLNLVSFAALPTGNGAYLIEENRILHYVSAERDLAGGRIEQPLDGGLLAVGGPAFDETSLFAALASPEERESAEEVRLSQSIPSTKKDVWLRGHRPRCERFVDHTFDPLPETVVETETIGRVWRETGRADADRDVVLMGASASETACKRAAPGKQVLHLATHGFFLGGVCAGEAADRRGIGGLASAEAESPAPSGGENPLRLSGLALAGANHRKAAGQDEEDGILTAEEVASLDLRGVEWAVLSACDTGIGEVMAGEGVLGLRRAFQVAGVRTLIMSLWPVEDRATVAWMRSLYRARLERGMDTAAAAHHAGLVALKDRRKKGASTHPFYWAGFVAAGDWR
jgi:CHAT domain-containing protein